MTKPQKIHRPNYPDNRRRWSDDDIARLLHMRDVQCLPWSVIDAALKRSKGGSQLKYGAVRTVTTERESRAGRRHAGVGRVEPSAEQIEARAARHVAAERMTTTAMFFGDPPPGYSALDRRAS